MTSRNSQDFKHSDANADTQKTRHRRHRHHVTSDQPDTEPKADRRVSSKYEHRHEHKISDDPLSQLQNHPIHSISTLLRTERYHIRKAKMFSPDTSICSDIAVNANHELCDNCHLPKLSEHSEHSQTFVSDHATLTKTKIVSPKSSRTKLKQGRVKQTGEGKHHHYRSSRKKEIYIITSGDTPLKFKSMSQERVHKHRRRSKKEHSSIKNKPEGVSSFNDDQSTNERFTFTERPFTASELSKRELVSKEQSILSDQKDLPTLEENTRQEEILEDQDFTNERENIRTQMVTVATDISSHFLSKVKRKSSENPKVISTKIKQSCGDMVKLYEDRSRRKFKKDRNRSIKNTESSNSNLGDMCSDTDDKLETSNCVSTILNKSTFRNQRTRPEESTHENSTNNRKRILDDIELAYSKHKHILPKEAVDALDRNIKQWRSMDYDLSNKSSDQTSNVLDLEEVLKRSKKNKLQSKEYSSETQSEVVMPVGTKKTPKPQNDLILMNAIVTGINDIDCYNETVHVNKIPKFVRLEKIISESEPVANDNTLSKENVIQECASESRDRSRGAIPKIYQVPADSSSVSQDLRKEVSFSQLNVQPAVTVYSTANKQFNYYDGMLPALIRENRTNKQNKCLDIEFLNTQIKKEQEEEEDQASKELATKQINAAFRVDGIEPPKKLKPTIPSAYIPRKNTPSDLEKLNLVALPNLEVPSLCLAQQVLKEATSSTNVLKFSQLQARRKENHRLTKSSKVSSSSSESTVQLIQLLDSPKDSEQRKRDTDLKRFYISDQDAIAALKYLSPQHREPLDPAVGRGKKLEKIMLSTLEIKSEIPTSQNKPKSSCIENTAEIKTKSVFDKYDPKARILVSSKETEFLFKSTEDEQVSKEPENHFASNVSDRSLEDYVSKDKCEVKATTSQTGSILSAKSSNSMCSVDPKPTNKRRAKPKPSDTVRKRMLNYARDIEHRKKRPQSNTGSSRDSSNDRDCIGVNTSLSKVISNPFYLDTREKKTSLNLTAASSSGISLDSEHERALEQEKPNRSENDTIASNSNTIIAVPSEMISAALTKITEETVSQVTLNCSELSCSKREDSEFQKDLKAGMKFGENNEKSVKTFSKSYIPRYPGISAPSTSKSKCEEADGKTDPEVATTKMDTANTSSVKEENGVSAMTRSSSDEKLRQLTESVKNSIINEMQAINNVNLQNIMQLILLKKDEGLEELITSNIENVLKKKVPLEQVEQSGTHNQNQKQEFSKLKFHSAEQQYENNNRPKFESTEIGDKKTETLFKKQTNVNLEVDNKKKEKEIAPSTPTEKSAKSKPRRISKLVRNIPRGVLYKTKEASTVNKPVSAPTGTDTNKFTITKKNDFLDKLISSDTKTTLASNRMDNQKDGSGITVITVKNDKPISKFEKRKLYGQLLREKVTKSKNTGVLTVINQPSTYSVGSNLSNGDNIVDEPVEEPVEEAVEQPPLFRESAENNDADNYQPHGSFLNVYTYSESANVNVTSEIDEACISYSKEMMETDNQLEPSTSGNAYVPEFTVRQWSSGNESHAKETENVYQTFTVMADHPNVVEVFKNQYNKSNCSLATLKKGSVFHSLSASSINVNEKVTSCLANPQEYEDEPQSLEKIEDLFSYQEGFQQSDENSLICRNESGLALSHEYSISSSEIPSSRSATTNESVSEIKKLSRVQVNLLDTYRKVSTNDAREPKYTLYSPYTCSRKNMKVAERDGSTSYHKEDPDNSLHRCNTKFNIHNMLKVNDNNSKVCKICGQHCSRMMGEQHRQSCSSNSSTNLVNSEERGFLDRPSRFLHKDDKDSQGNYVVFKIDQKLQVQRESSSTKDSSGECFKIFMNNNVEFDGDYPLRFSDYAYDSKLFRSNNFSLNSSETGESGYDSSNSKETQKFLRTLSKKLDTISPKDSYSTVITFPFKLRKLTDPSKILSAEKDSEVDVGVTETFSNSRLEQLCNSVTNLYKSLCNSKSTEYLKTCDHSQVYDSNTAAYYYRNKAQSSKWGKCSANDGAKPTTSKVTQGSKTTNKQRQGRNACGKVNEKIKNDVQNTTNKIPKINTANEKPSLKKSTPPELVSCGTSYESMKSKRESTQLVRSTNVIESLHLKPEFFDIVRGTIKKILPQTHILPKVEMEKLFESVVTASLESIAKEYRNECTHTIAPKLSSIFNQILHSDPSLTDIVDKETPEKEKYIKTQIHAEKILLELSNNTEDTKQEMKNWQPLLDSQKYITTGKKNIDKDVKYLQPLLDIKTSLESSKETKSVLSQSDTVNSFMPEEFLKQLVHNVVKQVVSCTEGMSDASETEPLVLLHFNEKSLSTLNNFSEVPIKVVPAKESLMLKKETLSDKSSEKYFFTPAESFNVLDIVISEQESLSPKKRKSTSTNLSDDTFTTTDDSLEMTNFEKESLLSIKKLLERSSLKQKFSVSSNRKSSHDNNRSIDTGLAENVMSYRGKLSTQDYKNSTSLNFDVRNRTNSEQIVSNKNELGTQNSEYLASYDYNQDFLLSKEKLPFQENEEKLNQHKEKTDFRTNPKYQKPEISNTEKLSIEKEMVLPLSNGEKIVIKINGKASHDHLEDVVSNEDDVKQCLSKTIHSTMSEEEILQTHVKEALLAKDLDKTIACVTKHLLKKSTAAQTSLTISNKKLKSEHIPSQALMTADKISDHYNTNLRHLIEDNQHMESSQKSSGRVMLIANAKELKKDENNILYHIVQGQKPSPPDLIKSNLPPSNNEKNISVQASPKKLTDMLSVFASKPISSINGFKQDSRGKLLRNCEQSENTSPSFTVSRKSMSESIIQDSDSKQDNESGLPLDVINNSIFVSYNQCNKPNSLHDSVLTSQGKLSVKNGLRESTIPEVNCSYNLSSKCVPSTCGKLSLQLSNQEKPSIDKSIITSHHTPNCSFNCKEYLLTKTKRPTNNRKEHNDSTLLKAKSVTTFEKQSKGKLSFHDKLEPMPYGHNQYIISKSRQFINSSEHSRGKASVRSKQSRGKLPVQYQEQSLTKDLSKTITSSSLNKPNHTTESFLTTKEKLLVQLKKNSVPNLYNDNNQYSINISSKKRLSVHDKEIPVSGNSTKTPSSSSLRGKLSVEEKKSLINDLKAFDNALTDLKQSITRRPSDDHIMKDSNSENKSLPETTPKLDSKIQSKEDVCQLKDCNCKDPSKSLESNELLQIMSKLPLSTIIALHKKVADSNDPTITFESLIEELHKANLVTQKMPTTKSQDRILKLLENSGTIEETQKDNSSIAVKNKISQLPTEEDLNTSSAEETEIQQDFLFENLKTSKSSVTLQPIDSNKQLLNMGIGKEEKPQSKQEHESAIPSTSQQAKDYETGKKLNQPLENENKRQEVHKMMTKLTDKQLFDKLLESYENEENMAHRLSNDDEFLKTQLQMVRSRESVEAFLKQPDSSESSVDNNVDDLENTVDSTVYNTMNKPALDKSQSKLTTLKKKISHLFKNNTQKKDSFSRLTMDDLIKVDKIKVSKTKYSDKLKKEETSLSSDDSNLVKPQEVGKYFMRGFRGDQMFLTGRANQDKSYKDDTSVESVVEFSERDTPLDYLLTLGYSVEEASNAIRDEDVENRLLAAITEARIWVNQLNSVQGTLLYLIAYKTKPKTMRYYLQLVEAIVNNRINNAVKLDSFLKVLEKVEDGDISMLYILGSDKLEDEENEEYLLKKQLRKVFIDIYRVAEKEATTRNEVLTKIQINLLKILAAKYRDGLQPHLEIIARYIGSGLLRSQVQLEAAMIYFSRLDSSDINLAKFERYCGIKHSLE